MATFVTTPALGTVLDGVIKANLAQRIARHLDEQPALFASHLVYSRGLTDKAAGTTPPFKRRLRCATAVPQVGTWLQEALLRAYARGLGQVVPHGRRVSESTLRAFVLEDGVALRADLAGGPAMPTDALLTFACRPDGPAEAALRVWTGQANVIVPLADGQVALTPASWPVEICRRGHAGPVFAIVVLVAVEER